MPAPAPRSAHHASVDRLRRAGGGGAAAALLLLIAGAVRAAPAAAQATALVAPRALEAPKTVWAAQTSPTEAALSWRPAPGATGYRVYASRGGGTPKAVASVGAQPGELARAVLPVATLLLPGIGPVVFSVQAVRSPGLVSPKASFPPLTLAEAADAGAAPAAPARVTATETAPGIVTVTWDAVPGASAYQVMRAVTPRAALQTVCALCPTEPRYVDHALTAGVGHSYAVTALGPGGASKRATSNVVTPTAGVARAAVARP